MVLHPDTWLSEIMARNLQSIRSGAVKIKDYAIVVQWEAENIVGVHLPKITLNDCIDIRNRFNKLSEEWDELSEQGKLILKIL